MARCKGCALPVTTLVVRLKSHANQCSKLKEQGLWPKKDGAQATLRVVRTSKHEVEQAHQAAARFIFAENLPFNTVEKPSFRHLLETLRPGIKPLGSTALKTTYLDMEYALQKARIKDALEGSFVTMSIDGWSGPLMQPTLGVALNEFLIDVVETKDNSHDSEYLVNFATAQIAKLEAEYGVTVVALVTDNASNVQKMRQEIKSKLPIFCYACQAHCLNLLAGDILNKDGRQTVVASMVAVLKAFRFLLSIAPPKKNTQLLFQVKHNIEQCPP